LAKYKPRKLGGKGKVQPKRGKAKPYQVIRYEVILYWSDEDQAFIAEVPELPGCAADGASYRQALANVETIIQEWIDAANELGRPIPEPKGRLTFA
jgi:predicted RNase H-like HicB family nuclease